jgi:hypothetical protein
MEPWLPWIIPLVGVSVVAGILGGAFSKKFEQSRFRWVLRISGIVLSGPIALVSLLALLMIGCESHGPLVGSPDHRHVARVLVADALGAVVQPVASVKVRRSWIPAWTDAYVGFGYPGNATTTMEPRVKWLDNLHLLIAYPTGGEQPAFCRERAGQVIVKCEVEARVSSGTEE